MDKIAQGASFASLASEYSTCPSKNQGGRLGSFRPGVMVPEFDQIVFNPDTRLNQVVGPVQTSVRITTISELMGLNVSCFTSLIDSPNRLPILVWIPSSGSGKANWDIDHWKQNRIYLLNYE